MIVHNLSPEALRGMTPVDLATVESEPPSPIGTFDFHGCTCGIGSFSGRPPWELHTGGDELLRSRPDGEPVDAGEICSRPGGTSSASWSRLTR